MQCLGDDMGVIFDWVETVRDYGYITQTWQALLAKYKNKIAVAGILGNFYAESKIVPYCREGNTVPPWTPSEQYTEKINNGSYTRNQFVNDGIGYSFPQWTYYTRKRAMYDFWKASGAQSIGDLYQVVLPFLYSEIDANAEMISAIAGAASIRDFTIYFLKNYERPLGMNDPKEWDKRHDMAEQIYRMCEGIPPEAGEYIAITPRIAELNNGDSVTVSVSASGAFSYSTHDAGINVESSETSFTIRCETDEMRLAVVDVFLTDNRDVITTFSALLNGGAEDETKIEITPKSVTAYANQRITFLIKSPVPYKFKLGAGLVLVEKTDNSITVKTIKADSAYKSYIDVYLSRDVNVKARANISVKGGGLPPTSSKKDNKSKWIYYIKPML